MTGLSSPSSPDGAASLDGVASSAVRPARVVRAEVTAEPVDAADLAAAVAHAGAGAVVTFEGVVRNHDGGRGVTGIVYSAHPSAGEVMARIAQDVAQAEGLRALGLAHRVGHLRVGDTALAVAVSADHRHEAFAAASQVVEEVKRLLPVWKQQLLDDGTTEWSNMA